MSSGPVVALLDTVTFPELMTFLVIALIVLGPDKLPGLARSAGQWVQKLRAMAENLQSEVTGALDESELQSLRELGEFAVRPRAKLVEYARKAGETDPDDYTDGDAPASSPPILPALGVGPDNPMITNGLAVGTDGDFVPVDSSPVIDAHSVDAEVVEHAADATRPEPAPAPVASDQPTLPAHLAGTRLATTPKADDPSPAAATDALVMSDPPAEPSTDDT
jgi:sec-independent protein translocase protein TatB